jgi:capsular polysaccharide biosynthesis protein
MELQEYLNVLRKRWILLIAITLVSTLISGVFSYFIIKHYKQVYDNY